jgi:hypothetical protein
LCEGADDDIGFNMPVLARLRADPRANGMSFEQCKEGALQLAQKWYVQEIETTSSLLENTSI